MAGTGHQEPECPQGSQSVPRAAPGLPECPQGCPCQQGAKQPLGFRGLQAPGVLKCLWGKWDPHCSQLGGEQGAHTRLVLGSAATPALDTESARTLPVPGFSHQLGRFCQGCQQGHHFYISILIASSSNYSPTTDTCGQKRGLGFFFLFTAVRLYLGSLASERPSQLTKKFPPQNSPHLVRNTLVEL